MKKILILILSLCLGFGIFSSFFTLSAAEVYKGIITIGKATANTGDEISIPIEISENPGIMATTISITYDSNSLEYIEFLKGKVLKDYTVVDHPSKNIIRFVSCESTNKRRNGILLTLRFRVKDNAECGFSKIDISYSQGDFCNWNLDKIMPTIISGGVDIAFNGVNCSHKQYGEWKTIAEPTCAGEGIKERICQTCNHIDNLKIEKVGHEFPEEWTVEKTATKDEPGTMVRYCVSCNVFVDRIEYTLEDSEQGDFDNEIGTEIPKNEIIDDNFQEQYPDKELTPIKPSDEQKPTSSTTTSSSSSENSNTSSQTKPTDSEPQTSSTPQSSQTESKPTLNDNEKNVVTNEDIHDKISEVIPNFTTILNYIKIAFILLLFLFIV